MLECYSLRERFRNVAVTREVIDKRHETLPNICAVLVLPLTFDALESRIALVPKCRTYLLL